MSRCAMLAAVMGFRKGGKLDRAIQKDTDERFEQREAELRSLELEEEDEERICPDDKVEYQDCRTLPCKVTCQ